MATVFRVNGDRSEVPDVSVDEARRVGVVPQHYVPVVKNREGFVEELSGRDRLHGDVLLLPRNDAGWLA